LRLAQIKAFNETLYGVPVHAVLQTDPSDDQIVTQIAILNPQEQPDSPQTLVLLDDLLV
jgi:hypothetical protein